MKNTYIFVTNTLYDIGGAQLYLNNKCQYLLNNNYNVYILTSEHGSNILFDVLKNNKKHIYEELRYPPFYFSEYRQNKLVKDILKGMDYRSSSKIYIESCFLKSSYWGEMIASELKAKHIVYLLQESFNSINNVTKSFLEFKYQRRELAGIKPDSLYYLFNKNDFYKENSFYLKPRSATKLFSNNVQESLKKIQKVDLNLCSISRLDKPHVKLLIKDVIEFSKENENMNIQLILIGESVNPEEFNNFIKLVEPIDNLSLIFLGRLFPIPASILNVVDIFIGTAGAATLTVKEKKLTIVYNNEYKVVGLLGIHTMESYYGVLTEKEKKLQEWLEILKSPKIRSLYEKKIPKNYKSIDNDYSDHIDFILNGSKTRKYNLSFLYKRSVKDYFIYLIINYLGIKNFELIVNFKNKITNK